MKSAKSNSFLGQTNICNYNMINASIGHTVFKCQVTVIQTPIKTSGPSKSEYPVLEYADRMHGPQI